MCSQVNAIVYSLLLLVICLSKVLDCKLWNLVGDKVLILTYPHRTTTRGSLLINAYQASSLVKLKSNSRQRSTMPNSTVEQFNATTAALTSLKTNDLKGQSTILSSILGKQV